MTISLSPTALHVPEFKIVLYHALHRTRLWGTCHSISKCFPSFLQIYSATVKFVYADLKTKVEPIHSFVSTKSYIIF